MSKVGLTRRLALGKASGLDLGQMQTHGAHLFHLRRGVWAHPDIEYVIVGGLTPGSWKGRAAMASAAGELFSVWEEHRSVVEEVRPLDGERALVLSHGSGRGKTSGVELDAAQWQVAALYQVRDGKVIRHVVYLDRADAFAALGIEE